VYDGLINQLIEVLMNTDLDTYAARLNGADDELQFICTDPKCDCEYKEPVPPPAPRRSRESLAWTR